VDEGDGGSILPGEPGCALPGLLTAVSERRKCDNLSRAAGNTMKSPTNVASDGVLTIRDNHAKSTPAICIVGGGWHSASNRAL
jgi:hypothetical protein